jgi:CDP-diacylglycerol--serine O-phosphatidyltransferase
MLVILSKIKAQIPNTLTLFNLMLGVAAVIHVLNGALVLAAVLIAFAALFDFLDGFAARLLNVKSEIGKELDSLADVVSFGVAPAVFLFTAIKSNPNPGVFEGFNSGLAYAALLIAAFSGYRLAKFNLDLRQTDSFLGLPTPANAIFIIPISLFATGVLHADFAFVQWIASNIWFQLLIIPLSCWLLVSEIPLFSLKFKHGFGFKANRIKYIFLILSLLGMVILGWAGIPSIILIYIALSLLTKN